MQQQAARADLPGAAAAAPANTANSPTPLLPPSRHHLPRPQGSAADSGASTVGSNRSASDTASTSVAFPRCPSATALPTCLSPPVCTVQPVTPMRLVNICLEPAPGGDSTQKRCVLRLRTDVAESLIEKGRAHEPCHSIFFTGDCGVGKTYVMLRLLEKVAISVAPWMLVVPQGSATASSAVSASSRSSASSFAQPQPSQLGQHSDVLDIPHTSGVTLHASKIVTPSQRYRVLYLDSEGFNASAPPPPLRHPCPPSPLPLPLSPMLSAAEADDAADWSSQEMHNSFRRPSVLQLLPHLAYRTGDVVVYVWDGCGEEGGMINSPGGALPNLADGDLQARLRRAYSDCLQTLRPEGREDGQRKHAHPNAPALLILLNKTPLRRCYVSASFNGAARCGNSAAPEDCAAGAFPQQQSHTSASASSTQSRSSPSSRGGAAASPSSRFDAHYVNEETCSAYIRALDDKNQRPLQVSYSDVRCYPLPLRGSKWRMGLTGSGVFESALTATSVLLHSMLRDVVKRRLRTHGDGVNVTELGWLASLQQVVQDINNLPNRWGTPQRLPLQDLHQMNATGFALHAQRVRAREAQGKEPKGKHILPAPATGAAAAQEKQAGYGGGCGGADEEKRGKSEEDDVEVVVGEGGPLMQAMMGQGGRP